MEFRGNLWSRRIHVYPKFTEPLYSLNVQKFLFEELMMQLTRQRYCLKLD